MQRWNLLRKKKELSVQDSCILWRVVVPPPGGARVLQEVHIAHPGVSRMKSLARTYVWWPRMDQDLENKVQHCKQCQENTEFSGRGDCLCHEFCQRSALVTRSHYKRKRSPLVWRGCQMGGRSVIIRIIWGAVQLQSSGVVLIKRVGQKIWGVRGSKRSGVLNNWHPQRVQSKWLFQCHWGHLCLLTVYQTSLRKLHRLWGDQNVKTNHLKGLICRW